MMVTRNPLDDWTRTARAVTEVRGETRTVLHRQIAEVASAPADGTCDIIFASGGEAVEASVLSSALPLTVGDAVVVDVWQGDLLVLGTVGQTHSGPHAVMSQTSDLTVIANASRAIPFETVTESDGDITAGTGNDGVTIDLPGRYMLVATVEIIMAAAEGVAAFVRVDASNTLRGRTTGRGIGGEPLHLNAGNVFRLAAGATVGVGVENLADTNRTIRAATLTVSHIGS